MNDFKVSVIIPVFNAAGFVRKAVESAVHLQEVGEVILVEDGSPDNAIDVCRELEATYGNVRLFTHPNRENRGAGASRNLGITKAEFRFLAFLDADDWYLPNRFTETKQIFTGDATVDGVYAPIGTHFNEPTLKLLGKTVSKEVGEQYITYFKQEVKPERLFVELLTMRYGTFSTDGVVLKKQLLEKTGLFREDLRLHQDSELWVRCAYFGKLVGVQDPSPVAIRGVHRDNRVNQSNFRSRSLYFSALHNFFKDKKLSREERFELQRKYVQYHPQRKFQHSNALLQMLEKVILWVIVKSGRILSSNRTVARS